jgi:hypothetical protein
MLAKFLGATSRICYAPENDNGGGGEPPPANNEEKQPAWVKELQDSMKVVGGGISELVNLAKGNIERQNQPPPKEDEDEEDNEESVDMETLTRAQFAQLVTDRIIKAVNKQVVSPLSDKMNTLSSSVEARAINSQVKELAVQRKDFWEWKEEMVTLAQRHRSLSPEELYDMARLKDPAKAKEMDKKFKMNGDDEEEGKGKPIKLSFGGLPPSGSTGGKKTENSRMAPKEAGEAAWEATVKALGGEPVLNEE